MHRRLITLLCLLSYLLSATGFVQGLSVANLLGDSQHRTFAESAPAGTVFYLHHAGHADHHEQETAAADQCWLSSCSHGHVDHVIKIADHPDIVPLVDKVPRSNKGDVAFAPGGIRVKGAFLTQATSLPPSPEPLSRSSRSVLIRSTVLLI